MEPQPERTLGRRSRSCKPATPAPGAAWKCRRSRSPCISLAEATASGFPLHRGAAWTRKARSAGLHTLPMDVRGHVHPLMMFRLGRALSRLQVYIVHSHHSKDLATLAPSPAPPPAPDPSGPQQTDGIRGPEDRSFPPPHLRPRGPGPRDLVGDPAERRRHHSHGPRKGPPALRCR